MVKICIYRDCNCLGSGFDSAVKSNNKIYIDGVICSVTQATKTTVKCRVGKTSAGSNKKVIVNVYPKGKNVI